MNFINTFRQSVVRSVTDQLPARFASPTLMLFVLSLVPALVAPMIVRPTTSRTTCIQALSISSPSRPGSLPEMYRARWTSIPTEEVNEVASSTPSTKPRAAQVDSKLGVATVVGALAGTGLAAGVGAFKSISEMPVSLTQLFSTWSPGGADDISRYTDAITDWVAMSNSFLLPNDLASISVTVVLAFDVVAVASIMLLVAMQIEEALQSKSGGDKSIAWEASELCVATSAEEPICGYASFDSSDGYACVEQYVNGKLRWVCA